MKLTAKEHLYRHAKQYSYFKPGEQTKFLAIAFVHSVVMGVCLPPEAINN